MSGRYIRAQPGSRATDASRSTAANTVDAIWVMLGTPPAHKSHAVTGASSALFQN